ncbi:TetR/AcrR family transcriptional regulator [Spirillospora sp. CA-294931]|uniref:TetR/AcrR family transcriptional regulator n=1 Tax=Spirillospora sp. CA-294931 TaxID=3240042 RepID=UPI003D8D74AE
MSARERILDAAAEVMRTRGAAKATTKEIARAAEYSEALLYKHFRDKEELILCVLRERMPAPQEQVRPGEGSVAGNLTGIARRALGYYARTFPMMASMAARPDLMAASRESMRKYGTGPQEPVVQLGAYLRAERELGRVRAEADTDAAAALLMGACFQQGFLRYYAEGAEAPDPPESDAAALVAPLLPGLLTRDGS